MPIDRARGLLGRAVKSLTNPGSLVQGTALSVIGAGGNRAFQIGALLLVAHRFGEQGLSAVSVIILWSSILGLAISPGFVEPLIGAVAGARTRGERSVAPIVSLIAAGVATVIFAAAAVWLYAGVTAPGLPPTRFALLLAAMASGFCVQAVTMAGLIAERAYRRAMLSSLMLGGGQVVAVLVASDPWAAVASVVSGTVFAGALSAAMLVQVARVKDRTATHGFTKWRVMLGRVPPSLTGSLVVEPTNLVVLTYIFGSARPPISTAVITVAQQWLSLLLFIPAIVNQVILPRLMHKAEADDFAAYRQQARLIIRWNFVLTLVAAVSLIVSAPFLLAAYHLDGAEYPFVMLVCAGWFSALAFSFGTVLTGLGHFNFGAFGKIFWCTVFVGASLLLVHRSTDGFAEARFVAYFTYLVLLSLATFIRLRRLRDGVPVGSRL